MTNVKKYDFSKAGKYEKLIRFLHDNLGEEVLKEIVRESYYRFNGTPVDTPFFGNAALTCVQVADGLVYLILKISKSKQPKEFRDEGFDVAVGKIKIEELIRFGYQGLLNADDINNYLVNLTIVKHRGGRNLEMVIPLNFQYDFRLLWALETPYKGSFYFIKYLDFIICMRYNGLKL